MVLYGPVRLLIILILLATNYANSICFRCRHEDIYFTCQHQDITTKNSLFSDGYLVKFLHLISELKIRIKSLIWSKLG